MTKEEVVRVLGKINGLTDEQIEEAIKQEKTLVINRFSPWFAISSKDIKDWEIKQEKTLRDAVITRKIDEV